MKNSLSLSERDLGVWFKLDGVAIKNQEQLDLAVIALAENYGLHFLPAPTMFALNGLVNAGVVSEQITDTLIVGCELAIRHLNDLATKEGYKFSFTGDQYEQLTLYKLGDLPN